VLHQSHQPKRTLHDYVCIRNIFRVHAPVSINPRGVAVCPRRRGCDESAWLIRPWRMSPGGRPSPTSSHDVCGEYPSQSPQYLRRLLKASLAYPTDIKRNSSKKGNEEPNLSPHFMHKTLNLSRHNNLKMIQLNNLRYSQHKNL
jgi:hypothetical protein